MDTGPEGHWVFAQNVRLKWSSLNQKATKRHKATSKICWMTTNDKCKHPQWDTKLPQRHSKLTPKYANLLIRSKNGSKLLQRHKTTVKGHKTTAKGFKNTTKRYKTTIRMKNYQRGKKLLQTHAYSQRHKCATNRCKELVQAQEIQNYHRERDTKLTHTHKHTQFSTHTHWT